MSKRPGPRPKRGGEEFARGHHQEAGNSSPKKPRFDVRNPSALAADAPEEDDVLDADEIGRRGLQAKRNAVNIDGYESDSSNEGMDKRKDSSRRKAAQSKDEEDMDMFADADENAEAGDDSGKDEDTTVTKKKNVKFLNVEEIEGQISNSKSGGHVGANFAAAGSGYESDGGNSSSDSEVDEETRARLDGDIDQEIGAGGKKKHAPKLDAFNLKNENEEGGFDENLNFVRKTVDPDAVHDSWLNGLSKKEIRKAKEAQAKREKDQLIRNREDDALLTGDVLAALIAQLEMGETAIEALARLGPKKKKPKWQKKKKKKTEEMQVDSAPAPTEEDPAEKKRLEAIEAITGAADKLLERGYNEIYDTEREMLLRNYKRETGEDYADKNKGNSDSEDEGEGKGSDVQWEYRWVDGRNGDDVHGPYDGATMRAWSQAGYFGEGIEFRRKGAEDWISRASF